MKSNPNNPIIDNLTSEWIYYLKSIYYENTEDLIESEIIKDNLGQEIIVYK